jgi:hypothetical protein
METELEGEGAQEVQPEWFDNDHTGLLWENITFKFPLVLLDNNFIGIGLGLLFESYSWLLTVFLQSFLKTLDFSLYYIYNV